MLLWLFLFTVFYFMLVNAYIFDCVIVEFLILLVVVAIAVVIIMGSVRLFNKCGQKGWKAIVPFYSTYVFCYDICGLHFVFPLLIILFSLTSSDSSFWSTLGTIVKAVCYGCAFYNLALRSNRKTTSTTVLGALLPDLMMIVFGYVSDFEYDEWVEVDEFGPFAPYINR